MFSLKKRFAKLNIISGFELTISCRPQGRADHCTTSVDAEICLCMVLVYLILHCGENVTLRLVSDIRRGARRGMPLKQQCAAGLQRGGETGPRLESRPDEEQCAHTKRVTRPAASELHPSARAETGTCMTANARAGSKSVQTMDIIA